MKEKEGVRASAVRSCIWGDSDSNEQAFSKSWPTGRRSPGWEMGHRDRCVCEVGAQRQAVKALGVSTCGELAAWIKTPWETAKRRTGQKKRERPGVGIKWASEPAKPQTPRAKVHARPEGKAGRRNPTRLCARGGAPGWVTVAAPTSAGISGKERDQASGQSSVTGEKSNDGLRERREAFYGMEKNEARL